MNAWSRFVIALLWAAGNLCAQSLTATLVGTVMDPAGAVVTAAKVEIRNTATNEVRRVESDHKGEFIKPNLPPGSYEVSISKEGFQTLRQKGLELQLDQQARMEFRLELGSISQTVEVTASVPLLNTENATKGDVVVSQEMLEMPLDGRNFSDLAELVPGVLPKAQGSRGSQIAIGGARADNTNFLVDGFDTRSFSHGQPMVSPNLDAMQEFKMQTSGYSAEYGHVSGGVMNMVLKSGGNQVHGSLFEFLRNDIFDARNFFNTSKSPLRRNQFGAMLNGPVFVPKLYDGRNRTFFLFSWESYRQRQGGARLGVVPGEAQRQGDFSGFAPIKDPLVPGTCNNNNRAACFPENRIPLSRLSPIALKIQEFYPLPNREGKNNFYASPPVPSDWDSFLVKIDQRLGPADGLAFRYSRRGSRSESPWATSNLGSFRNIGTDYAMLAGLTYTRMIRPAVINELRFGLTRSISSTTGDHLGTDYNAQFGLAGAPRDPRVAGFPQIVVSGYESLGDGVNYPVQNIQNNYTLSDTLTWVKGPHLMKFGGEILRFQFYSGYNMYIRGTYSFTGVGPPNPMPTSC